MNRSTLRVFCVTLTLVTLFVFSGCAEITPPVETSELVTVSDPAPAETTDLITSDVPTAAVTEIPPAENSDSVHVPVLMYHHFSDEPNDSTIVTPETFRRQLEFIKENGFTAVHFDELYAFVMYGEPLPEKPVCITFDDGYYSNYSIAFPILCELEMKATIFPIGWCIGKSEYKETGIPIYPHFGFDEMREMLSSGFIDIGSHTYDMHQSAAYETAAARQTALPLENESRESHVAALTADLEKYSVLIRKELGRDFIVLAYPHGAYDDTAEEVIHTFGIPITLSTSTDRHNYVVKGELRSLYALCRLNITEQITDEELLAWLKVVD